jgi:hypothetical protein
MPSLPPGVNARIPIPMDEVVAFCKKWAVTEFALFGSVLREDFRADSDVDVLVRLDPQGHCTLFDMVEMRQELVTLFGREVDLVSKDGIEASRNPLRKRSILASAEIVYAA